MTTLACTSHDDAVAIDNFSMTASDQWVDLDADHLSPVHRGADGAPVADMHLELARSGPIRRSQLVDAAFKLQAWRLEPGAELPAHLTNLDQLVIVVEGTVSLAWTDASDVGRREVEAGGFWVTPAGAQSSFHAGAAGAVVTRTLSGPFEELETTWVGTTDSAPTQD